MDEEGAVGGDRDRAIGLLGAQVGGGVADEAGQVDVAQAEFGVLVGN